MVIILVVIIHITHVLWVLLPLVTTRGYPWHPMADFSCSLAVFWWISATWFCATTISSWSASDVGKTWAILPWTMMSSPSMWNYVSFFLYIDIYIYIHIDDLCIYIYMHIVSFISPYRLLYNFRIRERERDLIDWIFKHVDWTLEIE